MKLHSAKNSVCTPTCQDAPFLFEFVCASYFLNYDALKMPQNRMAEKWPEMHWICESYIEHISGTNNDIDMIFFCFFVFCCILR